MLFIACSQPLYGMTEVESHNRLLWQLLDAADELLEKRQRDDDSEDQKVKKRAVENDRIRKILIDSLDKKNITEKKLVEQLKDMDSSIDQRSIRSFALAELLKGAANAALWKRFIKEKCSTTPLFIAAWDGNSNALRLLLDQGNAINAKNINLETALHLAALQGHTDAVRLLVARKADLEAANLSEHTPLHEAAAHGHVDVMTVLLDSGARIGQTQYGCHALFQAASFGQKKALELLLTRGVSIQEKDACERTVLHHAVSPHGRVEVIEFLLDRDPQLITMTDNLGRTALHVASESGHVGAIELLLARGAQIARADVDGKTALHYAAYQNQAEALKLLLDNGAQIDARDNQEKTALHDAANNDSVKSLAVLLERKAHIDAADNEGNTVLHYCAERDCVEGITLLLDKKAQIGLANNEGRTALHKAAWSSQLDAVQLLLKRGAPTENKDNEGKTALQCVDVFSADIRTIFATHFTAQKNRISSPPDALQNDH